MPLAAHTPGRASLRVEAREHRRKAKRRAGETWRCTTILGVRARMTLLRPALATASRRAWAASAASPRQHTLPRPVRGHLRALSNSAQRPASVSDIEIKAEAESSTSHDPKSRQRLPHATREVVEAKRAQKFAQYEALLKEKAAR